MKNCIAGKIEKDRNCFQGMISIRMRRKYALVMYNMIF